MIHIVAGKASSLMLSDPRYNLGSGERSDYLCFSGWNMDGSSNLSVLDKSIPLAIKHIDDGQ